MTEKLKLKAVQAYGVAGPAKNLKAVGRFQKDTDVQVLVAHPISAGSGLNLQHVCRAILFIEIPVTANQYTQCVGRVCRIGQTRPIIIWLATAKKTIQMSLRRTVTKNEDLVQTMLPTKATMRAALFGEGD